MAFSVTFFNKKAATFSLPSVGNGGHTSLLHKGSIHSAACGRWARCLLLFCSTFIRLIIAICGSSPSTAPTCMWSGGDQTNGHANGRYAGRVDLYIFFLLDLRCRLQFCSPCYCWAARCSQEGRASEVFGA